MTEQTIRSVAKDMAFKYYDMPCRTAAFRKAFPTFKHYARGQVVKDDGSIMLYIPAWRHFVDEAIKTLGSMLRPEYPISDYMKECIRDALVENARREEEARQRKTAKDLFQIGMKDA